MMTRDLYLEGKVENRRQRGPSRLTQEGSHIFRWLKCGEYGERRQKQGQRDRKVLEEAGFEAHGKEFQFYPVTMDMALSREVTYL